MSTSECVPVTVGGHPALVLRVTADDMGIAEGQDLSVIEFLLVALNSLAWVKTFKAIAKARDQARFI